VAGGEGAAPEDPRESLRDALDARGWTIEEFAWAIGYSKDFADAVLDNRNFTADLAVRLEAALDVSAESWTDARWVQDLPLLREQIGGELAGIRWRTKRVISWRTLRVSPEPGDGSYWRSETNGA
jgi:plasmid maintenance system antidote protein VapI